MYFFDKKIVYLIWEMQEGHARGVGTARFLAMDAVCRIEINITGCGKVQGTYPVYVLSGDMQSLLGEIELNKGKGNLFIKCSSNALGHQKFPYKKITGIHIDLKTEGCLTKRWLPMVEEIPEKPDQELTQSKLPEQESRPVESAPPEPVKEPVKAEPEPVREAMQVETEAEAKPAKLAEGVKPPEKEEFRLYSNKWQQLCAIYPIVHPFNDGRAYLSVEPRDFVILQERFQPMVQNSFLLHGFYHYRHLLLGRSKQGKSIQYYLGVPGVFYEKEKAAALFYGFESFEGAVTPAPEGSFGYYMKRVQI